LEGADLIVWCSAANLPASRREEDNLLFEQTRQYARACVRVQTQADRPDAEMWLREEGASSIEIDSNGSDSPEVSAVTGAGFDRLADMLRESLATSHGTARQWLGMTAARCRESLEGVVEALRRAEESAGIESVGDELIAVDIRDALDHLGHILGVIYTDDILDRVFSKFCIGK
jgi:tRNA modification GTPase